MMSRDRGHFQIVACADGRYMVEFNQLLFDIRIEDARDIFVNLSYPQHIYTETSHTADIRLYTALSTLDSSNRCNGTITLTMSKSITAIKMYILFDDEHGDSYSRRLSPEYSLPILSGTKI